MAFNSTAFKLYQWEDMHQDQALSAHKLTTKWPRFSVAAIFSFYISLIKPVSCFTVVVAVQLDVYVTPPDETVELAVIDLEPTVV